MRKVINFIVFQAAWFAAVLGAANNMPWLGVLAVPLVLALHLALSPDWRPELLLALAAAVTGFVFDSILVAAGSFSPEGACREGLDLKGPPLGLGAGYEQTFYMFEPCRL